jgi:hypothetical protein
MSHFSILRIRAMARIRERYSTAARHKLNFRFAALM